MPNSLEKIDSKSTIKTLEKLESTDKDVLNVSENISDAIDLESIEALTLGNISEKNSKKASEDNKSTKSNLKPILPTSNTGFLMPPPKQMRQEVERKIRLEIHNLTEEAMKLSKTKGKFYELANVLRKLRKLKFLLNSLVRFSVDQVKNLWLRFIKEEK